MLSLTEEYTLTVIVLSWQADIVIHGANSMLHCHGSKRISQYSWKKKWELRWPNKFLEVSTAGACISCSASLFICELKNKMLTMVFESEIKLSCIHCLENQFVKIICYNISSDCSKTFFICSQQCEQIGKCLLLKILKPSRHWMVLPALPFSPYFTFLSTLPSLSITRYVSLLLTRITSFSMLNEGPGLRFYWRVNLLTCSITMSFVCSSHSPLSLEMNLFSLCSSLY